MLFATATANDFLQEDVLGGEDRELRRGGKRGKKGMKSWFKTYDYNAALEKINEREAKSN